MFQVLTLRRKRSHTSADDAGDGEARARSPNLRFELETVYVGADSITIAYVRNGETRVCETMEFSGGKVVRGVVARAA